LKQNGVDPHEVKDIVPGTGSEFDIKIDRQQNLWAIRKGKENSQAEPQFLGNLKEFKGRN
jgi:hypothetical protein